MRDGDKAAAIHVHHCTLKRAVRRGDAAAIARHEPAHDAVGTLTEASSLGQRYRLAILGGGVWHRVGGVPPKVKKKWCCEIGMGRVAVQTTP